MTTDPKKDVEDYLRKHGVPFEMKVASRFQQQNFGIHQSFYYADAITGAQREIDVIAIWNKQVRGINFNVVFVIECKFAKSPWILFSSITEGFPICYVTGDKAIRWILHLEKQPFWTNFFEVEQNIGHGLTTSNTKDNAYEGVQQLLGFLKSEKRHHRFEHGNEYTIYIPIIAVRGKLYKAKLDRSEEVEATEINEAQVYFKEDLNGVIPKVHIVTESHLDAYIDRLVLDCRRLFETPYMSVEITNPSLTSLGP